MKLLIPLLLALATALLPCSAQQRPKPDFLLLLSDDQTFRALGLLGELEVKTPNLDRLAKSGTTFTHAFNPGGWSGAVCIPSRTMLNTGRQLWTDTGPKQGDIGPDTALWGETLRNAGYDTFIAGKWHLPDQALKRSFASHGPLTGGFLPSTPVGGPAYDRPAPGNDWTPDDPKWAGHWLKAGDGFEHSSVRIADAAIRYLGDGGDKPRFAYIGFNAPHDPRQAPRADLDLYPPATLKLPPNFLPEHPFAIGSTRGVRDEVLAPYPRTPDIVRVHLQEYYALITHLDAQIGRVLDALEASGRAANTVILFTSDHGLAVGQHGLFGKQNLYDHSLRVPLILAGPGIPKDRRCDALVYLHSLFATTCELAGIPLPAGVEFPSLLPLLDGRKPALHDAIYAAYLNQQRAVRTTEWKLIRTPDAGKVQLFHIASDPWEMHDLSADPKYAETLRSMDHRLLHLMEEWHDPLPPDRLRKPDTSTEEASTSGPETSWAGFGEPGTGRIAVTVTGDVRHPGRYHLQDGADLSSIFTSFGGWGGNGDFGGSPPRRVSITRLVDGKPAQTSYRIKQMTHEQQQAVKLRDGDLLHYPTVIF